MLGWAGNQGQGQGVQIQGSTEIDWSYPTILVLYVQHTGSQSVAVARAELELPRAVLDLHWTSVLGGLGKRDPLPTRPKCPVPTQPAAPTSARPSPALRASAACDESSLEPWALDSREP